MRALSIARRSGPGAKASRRLQSLTPAALRDSETLTSLWRSIRYTYTPPPDEQLMLELRRRYAPEVEALSEYLGRDLVAEWGYARIETGR